MEIVAVIDFETTGLSPAQGDRATEIAAVLLENGKVVDRYQSLMNAGVRIPSYIEALTGISDAMIRRAPPVAEVMREVSDFVGDYPLVAHNASFDSRFWDAELARIQRARKQDFVCSCRSSFFGEFSGRRKVSWKNALLLRSASCLEIPGSSLSE